MCLVHPFRTSRRIRKFITFFWDCCTSLSVAKSRMVEKRKIGQLQRFFKKFSWFLRLLMNRNAELSRQGMDIAMSCLIAAGQSCLVSYWLMASFPWFFLSHPAYRNICPAVVCVIWAYNSGFLIPFKNCWRELLLSTWYGRRGQPSHGQTFTEKLFYGLPFPEQTSQEQPFKNSQVDDSHPEINHLKRKKSRTTILSTIIS